MESKSISITSCIKRRFKKLNLFIENTRKLEELNIEDISVSDPSSICKEYFCRIYRDKQNSEKIITITKYYTDGLIDFLSPEIITNQRYKASSISFMISQPATFVLDCQNREQDRLYRGIQITGFDFNSEYLPSEEELKRYEIPETLILKK